MYDYDDRYDWDPRDYSDDPYEDFTAEEISLYATDPEGDAL
jgi:hypothetical protein